MILKLLPISALVFSLAGNLNAATTAARTKARRPMLRVRGLRVRGKERINRILCENAIAHGACRRRDDVGIWHKIDNCGSELSVMQP